MPEVIYDVELREKDANNVFDIIYHPFTKVENVVGLVDVNNKFNLSLFPDWLFTAKRNAGAINPNITTTLNDVLTQIKNALGLVNVAYLNGAYMTANAGITIGTYTDHIIINSDDGATNAGSVTLEANDTLTFIGTRQYVGAPTGYEFEATDLSDYNGAALKWQLSGSANPPAGSDVMANLLALNPGWTAEDAYNYCQGDGVARYDDGFSYTYWRLTPQGTAITQFMWSVTNNNYPLATTSVAGLMSASSMTKLNGIQTGANNYEHPSYSDFDVETTGVETIQWVEVDLSGHVTNVTKRTLPSASQTVPGVMSAADKTKLDGIATGANNYEHPYIGEASITTTGIQVIDELSTNDDGHVTFMSTRNLPDSSTSVKGVVELATTTESKTGTDAVRAVTPAGVKAAIDYLAGLKVYADLTAANSAQANHAVGSLVLVKV